MQAIDLQYPFSNRNQISFNYTDGGQKNATFTGQKWRNCIKINQNDLRLL